MSTPAQQAAALLKKSLPGPRSAVAVHVRRSEAIAEAVYGRFGAIPAEWQAKHLRWYLQRACAALSPATRYDHWRTVAALLAAMHREHWEPHLRGEWQRRDGGGGPVAATGRPPTMPVRRR